MVIPSVDCTVDDRWDPFTRLGRGAPHERGPCLLALRDTPSLKLRESVVTQAGFIAGPGIAPQPIAVAVAIEAITNEDIIVENATVTELVVEPAITIEPAPPIEAAAGIGVEVTAAGESTAASAVAAGESAAASTMPSTASAAPASTVDKHNGAIMSGDGSILEVRRASRLS